MLEPLRMKPRVMLADPSQDRDPFGNRRVSVVPGRGHGTAAIRPRADFAAEAESQGDPPKTVDGPTLCDLKRVLRTTRKRLKKEEQP